jgi:PPOX class probable F420-dependent enzyme
VDAAEMRKRLAEARVGRLATVAPDGQPHLVPCCFELSGDTVYSAVDGKPKSTRALRRLENIRANARVALLVDFYNDEWDELWWVRVDANGRVIGADDDARSEFGLAVELLSSKYEQYRVDAPAGPVVALDIVQWRGWP